MSSAITGFEAFLRLPAIRSRPTTRSSISARRITRQNQWQTRLPHTIWSFRTTRATNAVPEAYYKRGLAQERLGQVDAARASWETVAKNFPDSDGGRLAKQSLDRLAAERRRRRS